MARFSKDLIDTIDIVLNYYKDKDEFKILQKIIYFMIDSIDLVKDDYLILPRDKIRQYLHKAKKIWGKDGSPKELKKVFDEYEKELTKIKDKNEIKFNYHTAWCLIMTVLHNFRDEPFEYHIHTNRPNYVDTAITSACRTISIFIETLPRMDIEDEKIIFLIKKYFNEIV